MRLPNVGMLLCWPARMRVYGSVDPLQMRLPNVGMLLCWPARMRVYGSVDPLQMRLPNVGMLLCWPSRMRVYGFVENRTFLEQFVRMRVPAQFCRFVVSPP